VRRLLLAALTATALLCLAAPALASRTQEATFQDDNQLLYTDPASMVKRVAELKRLGVDRLRLTILWLAVAPDPFSRTRPAGFDATDPDAYPAANWARYDAIVQEARKQGIGVNFNVTGPSPLWANKVPPRDDIADNYEPSPSEFAQFVAALGRRYSGNWPETGYAVKKLPRVSYWSIWNEPNHSGWLTPTWQKSGKHWFERSASLYRELLDGAYASLRATGHGKDTILFGETAPSGNDSHELKRYMQPLDFVRALYCVNRKLKRLKGRKAKLLDCPKKARSFRKAHPALFRATGFAHHPYQLVTPPNIRPRDRDIVTMAVLGRLTRTLDRIQRRYGSKRKLPLYLTEYGYQTPPDPLGVPLPTQAAYINQSEWMAFRNRRVRTMAQFLLVDDGDPIGLTFQSGLITREGKRKPAYDAYRLPVWVSGRGKTKRVWTILRPAKPKARARARIQYKPAGAKRYRTIRRVRSRGVRNVVDTKVRIKRGGTLRVLYGKHRSRTVLVL
jgi:hypothetical protein